MLMKYTTIKSLAPTIFFGCFFLLSSPSSAQYLPTPDVPGGIYYSNEINLKYKLRELKDGLPFIVNHTSTDKRCKDCASRNIAFEKAHKKLGHKFRFIQFDYIGWYDFKVKYSNQKRLPSIQIAIDGVQVAWVRDWENSKELIDNIENEFRQANLIFSDEYTDVNVEQTTSKKLFKNVKKRKSEKHLVVHITTSDEEFCYFCKFNKLYYRAVARNHSDKIDFLEIKYSSYKEFLKDKRLHKFLTKNHSANTGLPNMVVYKGNTDFGTTPYAVKPGLSTQMISDFEKIVIELDQY